DAGRNHMAKAGLRAEYAATLVTDNQPLDSYLEIHDAACDALPPAWHALLGALLEAKTTDGDSLPDPVEVLRFVHTCESIVAGAPRLETTGSSPGRLAESFHFTTESISAK